MPGFMPGIHVYGVFERSMSFGLHPKMESGSRVKNQ